MDKLVSKVDLILYGKTEISILACLLRVSLIGISLASLFLFLARFLITNDHDLIFACFFILLCVVASIVSKATMRRMKSYSDKT